MQPKLKYWRNEMLKKDLIKKIEALESQLDVEQSRPTGSVITDCHIDMGDSTHIVAVAEAVKAGMEALKSATSQNKYGIYIDGGNNYDLSA